MENKILYLKTLLCCSACDGEIATEEINLIKGLVAKSQLFDGIDVESELNKLVTELNTNGVKFLQEYLHSLKDTTLSENEQLLIVKLAIDMIEADNQILYSEVKFFKRIRQNLTISDEAILTQYPDKEDYLLPDIIEPLENISWDYNFSEIKLS